MDELIRNVIKWAADRNIIEGSTAIKQLDKTSEEFNELQRAVAKHQAARSHGDQAAAFAEIIDGFGDVLVTLIIAAAQYNLSIERCLSSAFDEIKDRKGRLVDGKFLKDAG